jgi:DNA invertase Pin-like site-specific DNA recombinase
MTGNDLIPAAQYVRMSTEHQQYSLENQSAAIQKYAVAHGFEIVRTYSDAAKSGLVLTHRTGLQQLLQDVVGGIAVYRAVLVYDVSRWGRFQDTDESAHYEFLCKSSGVPIHYCAETFANDGTLPSLIMKALKRTMAGEYSRELGVKILAGQKRLAQLGFKQGGRPGYGLRRMLLSPTGTPKQELSSGERKSITTDRVILVPGPANEVQCVRDIYRMLLSGRTVYAIARELNRRGIAYTGESEWDYQAVYGILTHPKYAGCHVFARTSSRLRTPAVKQPRSEWIVAPNAFEPIIEASIFERAQTVLASRTFCKSDDDLLDDLRHLLASEGRICLKLIKNRTEMASPSAYRDRFGSLRRAYELIGYGRPDQFGPLELRRRTKAMREELLARIVDACPNDVSISRRGGRWRGCLLVKRLTVAVIVARRVRVWKNTVRWQVDPVWHERNFVTLLARLNEENSAFLDFRVFPRINRRRRFWISQTDPWVQRGKTLSDLAQFCQVVASFRSQA